MPAEFRIENAAGTSSGQWANGWSYFPFGQELGESKQTDRMRFTGHERDFFNPDGTADDLDYMHARFRSPLTGRFLSTDPVLGTPKLPQSWNRYAYVSGNPLRNVDPDGRVQFDSLLTKMEFYQAVDYLSQDPGARIVLEKLASLRGASEPWVFATEGATGYRPSLNIIEWNSSAGLDVRGLGGKAGAGGSWIQSPAMGLLHEVAHTVQNNSSPEQFKQDSVRDGSEYTDPEERRVITQVESPAATALGEPTRAAHDGTQVPAKTPPFPKDDIERVPKN